MIPADEKNPDEFLSLPLNIKTFSLPNVLCFTSSKNLNGLKFDVQQISLFIRNNYTILKKYELAIVGM